jgi:hypothetical protein
VFKISDPEYYLPVIEALIAGKVMSSGRTKPMIIQGVCSQTGEKGEYVVKLRGSSHLWQGSSQNEILGSFIAAELGFQLPHPVIVNISKELVENMQVQGHENHTIAFSSLGYNFGSTLEGGYQELQIGQTINKQLESRLLDLFGLDILIGNTDRRAAKPNFLTNGKDLLIFDHELAFSFIQQLPFARNPSPWLILPEDVDWLQWNFCYQRFKGNSYDFSNFVSRLDVLNEEFWVRAWELIPAKWRNLEFKVIKDYLTKVVNHKNEFASELNRVLL